MAKNPNNKNAQWLKAESDKTAAHIEKVRQAGLKPRPCTSGPFAGEVVIDLTKGDDGEYR